ncbi:MAG: ligase-associated DNA damage response endonuclease PdeM [Pseudomonadota bacterium]
MRHEVEVNGHELVLDREGVLYWPSERILVVADLHMEKGSALARRGALLPPYDTVVTLQKLEAIRKAYEPITVVSLGDGFHDGRGPKSLSLDVFDQLTRVMRGVQWCWITGNHDPLIPLELGGAAIASLDVAGLRFRHEPQAETGEVAGHLHPKARVSGRSRKVSRPCFATDNSHLLMPAFGWYAGGLNVLNKAVNCLFPTGFDAYLLGDKRLYRLPHGNLMAKAYEL